MVAAWVLLAYAAGGKNLAYMYDPASAILVLGGTTCYALTCSPISEMLGLLRVYRNAFIVKIPEPTALIERIVGFAEMARREGILALEQGIEDGDDPFMSQGIRLAVDGTEPDLIVDVLETEVQCIVERHKSAQALINTLGDAAPAFGMIGTLIGLIVMLNNMNDPSQIGPGMAIAIITTLYGALLCNLVFKPVAFKLNTYSHCCPR
jgi:chemotaxis protein MotA